MSLKAWEKPLNRVDCANGCGKVVVSPHRLSENEICGTCLEIERRVREHGKEVDSSVLYHPQCK